VRETQVCTAHTKGVMSMALDSTVTLLDIPFSTSFDVHVRFELHHMDHSTTLSILAGVNFRQYCLFERKIRNESLNDLRATYAEWAERAVEAISQSLETKP